MSDEVRPDEVFVAIDATYTDGIGGWRKHRNMELSWDVLTQRQEIKDMDSDTLTAEIVALEHILSKVNSRTQLCKNEMRKRLMEKEKDSFFSMRAGAEVRVNHPHAAYNEKVLDEILEFVDENVLVELGAYTPARLRHTSRKWHTDALKYNFHGLPYRNRIQAILDKAKKVLPPDKVEVEMTRNAWGSMGMDSKYEGTYYPRD